MQLGMIGLGRMGANMSRRLADALREEIEEQGSIKPKEGEEAMTQVVNAIRRLQAAGEITLIDPADTDEDED